MVRNESLIEVICMLGDREKQMVEAVIQKAECVCPGSLAMVGVYGSFATGDVHEKSDLDLLILIDDERGYQLSHAFILDDTGVGYDLYCTTWQRLESDAQCRHPHLAKLLDSQIVYMRHPDDDERLNALRVQAKATLASPVRFERSREVLAKAKSAYADCAMALTLHVARAAAAEMISYMLDAVMLYHGRYFSRGVKRTFEETQQLNLPFDLQESILRIIRAESSQGVVAAATETLRAITAAMPFPAEKAAPSASNLTGTYEEMYSNWRGKMAEANAHHDVFASFMNLAWFQGMLQGIAAEVEIPQFAMLDRFDPVHLELNAALFDETLASYEAVYRQAGMQPVRYRDVEAFRKMYAPNGMEA